jgi:hypothetical protein
MDQAGQLIKVRESLPRALTEFGRRFRIRNPSLMEAQAPAQFTQRFVAGVLVLMHVEHSGRHPHDTPNHLS